MEFPKGQVSIPNRNNAQQTRGVLRSTECVRISLGQGPFGKKKKKQNKKQAMYQSQFCLEELATLKEKVKRFRDRLVYTELFQIVNMKRNFLRKFFHRQRHWRKFRY